MNMTHNLRVIYRAQDIFNRTLPRQSGGKLIEIPYERWQETTRAHFRALAEMEIANGG